MSIFLMKLNGIFVACCELQGQVNLYCLLNGEEELFCSDPKQSFKATHGCLCVEDSGNLMALLACG